VISNLDLQNEIISKIKPIISAWMDSDIYAISFFVYDKQDNPCEPTFTLGYNTERNYQKALAGSDGGVMPVDESEARWNYPWWPMNNFLLFGEGETAGIVKQWIMSMGLAYLTNEEFYDTGRSKKDFHVLLDEYSIISNEFIKVLICVVKQLHETGFIENKFGRKIPILIHEFECYDEIAIQNIEANGLPLVQDFVDFIGYRPE